jgi:uncharacterized protein YdbL (DUF1318 family)
MDEDARTAGARVGADRADDAPTPERTPEADAAADRSPQEIRADIQQTRAEVGDTVEALTEKTDVKAQGRKRISEIKANAQAKGEQLAAKAKSTTPQGAQQSSQQLVVKARENPAPIAVGAAVLVAFLIGRRTGRS